MPASPPSPCPPLTVTERIARGDPVDGDELRHVESCATCRTRLEEIRANNSLLDELTAAEDHRPLAAVSRPDSVRIPGYEVLDEIHRGGQGIVYRAVHAATRRTVAVKVMLAGALATSRQRRRFEGEIELVAGLSHPNIVVVHDSGVTDNGWSYFTMEHVEGRPLTEYAESEGLDTRGRLALLARVCRAVQYAHRHGVIHRDLKPANILVTAAGEPKILDFGVARGTESDLQVTTLRTGTGQLLGTLQYMSPEQVSGDPTAIDTRSDVYALGVVAYELLSGRPPYDLERTMIHDAVRIIREVDARPLSSVDRGFRGDVATIIARALEKDRSRRYQSAADLADDIERYLGDQAIFAHPPSRVYQVIKFTRRNRILVGGIGAVFLVLVAGIISSLLLLAEANRAKSEAQTARSDSDAAERFYAQLLLEAGELGRDARASDILRAGIERLSREELADRPLAEARIRYHIFIALMRMQEYELAEPHVERVLEIIRLAQGEDHEETLEYANVLGVIYIGQSRLAEAEQLLTQTLEIQRRLLGDDHPDVLNTMTSLAAAYDGLGRFEQAEKLYVEVLEIQRRTLGHDDSKALNTANLLAALYYNSGRLEDARLLNEQTLQSSLRVLGEDAEPTLRSMNNLGVVYREMERYEDAIELFARAAAGAKRNPPPGGWLAGMFMTRHGQCLTVLRRFDEAEAVLREAHELLVDKAGPEHPRTVPAISALVELYEAWGRPERAEYRALLPPDGDVP